VDEDLFWATIEEARRNADDTDDIIGNLSDILNRLEDDQLVGFQHQMVRQSWKCYRWNLRAALYIIVGEENFEDAFTEFTGWLIVQGKEGFERLLADPDSLADLDLPVEDLFAGEVLTMAEELYRDLNDAPVPADANFTPPEEPAGEELDEDDFLARLPKLCDRYEFEPSAT
jgi:Protein of unknown function (DUF4240)